MPEADTVRYGLNRAVRYGSEFSITCYNNKFAEEVEYFYCENSLPSNL